MMAAAMMLMVLVMMMTSGPEVQHHFYVCRIWSKRYRKIVQPLNEKNINDIGKYQANSTVMLMIMSSVSKSIPLTGMHAALGDAIY